MTLQNGKRGREVVDLVSKDDEGSEKRSKLTADTGIYADSFLDDGLNSRDAWSAATAEISSTQEFDDDELSSLQLYAALNDKIVGVRYYNGRATIGESVVIRREPGNPYDSNAIRIDNVMNVQIGKHGKRKTDHYPRLFSLISLKGISSEISPQSLRHFSTVGAFTLRVNSRVPKVFMTCLSVYEFMELLTLSLLLP